LAAERSAAAQIHLVRGKVQRVAQREIGRGAANLNQEFAGWPSP